MSTRDDILTLDDAALARYADDVNLTYLAAKANWQVAVAEIERRRVERAWSSVSGDDALWCLAGASSTNAAHLLTREPGTSRGPALCGATPYAQVWVPIDDSERRFQFTRKCQRCERSQA